MIKDLLPNFNIDSRQLIASKVAIIFSIIVILFFVTYNYIVGNYRLFYVNLLIIASLSLLFIFFLKKNIFVISKIAIFIITIGVIFVVYYSKGQDNTYLWLFVANFFFMFMFGYKKGLICTGLLFVAIFSIMYSFLGETISQDGYIRLVVVSIILALIAYVYEYSIQSTLLRLEKTQKELKEMTRVDSLTTLFNRRYFDKVFPEQIKISKRNTKLLVFVILDIDYFKNYNDEYGHQAGDEVLKKVSLSMKNTIHRPDDFVFRVGGEEFGVLFNADDTQRAIELVERIRESIEELNIPHIGSGCSPYVTISAGFYIIEPNCELAYEAVYRICDRALYEAKQNGRNQIKLANKK